ncbi:MAG TPA: BTAD domain-containing putative transcriptional regulator [Streptosporangiaceae bacterium]|nr:BTAD domain-containing putative transcriptional regulator [Streptosporangiaceae bacterium]
MKSLALRVLGEFAVDGIEPAALGSRKARLALQLLALAQGRAVPSAVLADALWGDTQPASPDDQLAVLMSRLRTVLGRDRIAHRDGGYLLRCDWLDAVELGHLVEEIERRSTAGNMTGAAAAARVALSLLRGDGAAPLPGDWAALRLAEIDRLAARARLVAASALLEAGDWMAACDAAATALQHDPYDEAALRVLLRGRVLGGQVAAALAAYADTRVRLTEDLGTDPSPETVSLYTAILRGEVPTVAAGSADDAMGLVGRANELAFLDAIVRGARDGAVNLVVIEGEAGIGKTTLLRAWAARRAAAGDIVLVANCGPLDRSLPLDALLSALATVLRRLGPEVTADLLADDTPMLAPLLAAAHEPRPQPMLADSMLGPAVFYTALTRVLGRLGARGSLSILVDDAHLAGHALVELLHVIRRAQLTATVVAAVRAGEGERLPGAAQIRLDVLDKEAAAELVGAGRVDALYARSGGHPLFLTELAQQASEAELPASLVDSVSARCDELGAAGATLRTAALIGPELDLDLLAAVVGRPVIALLDDCEQAVGKQFLAEQDGRLSFRHELLRSALAASATAGRAALLHRQVGRVLAARPDADPLLVAEHARLGGDVELAATALREASGRAAERFEHAAAERLLDDALSLHASPESWLARARVRTRRGRYDAALRDVDRAAPAGPAALEVGAWASYFGRRFAQAAQFAADGALAAPDPATRARCLTVGGRTWHAAGDLRQAELLLGEAMALANGADRVTAAAWLGVLRSHQSRVDEALELLRPAARGQIGVEHTSATLHALLFTGHAHALAGNAVAALAAFSHYTAEVERREVPRFAGRAVNFSGWVLRNLGATQQALDLHVEALALGGTEGRAELTIAAIEDLADLCLDAGDTEGAAARLDEAAKLLSGDLVFGWRLAFKHQLLTARLALARGDAEEARSVSVDLTSAAAALNVPRYASVAGLTALRAGHALGLPYEPAAVEADLDLLDRGGAIEAWRWTGEVGAAFGSERWLNRAEERVRQLAARAGSHADQLHRAADARLADWRRRAR